MGPRIREGNGRGVGKMGPRLRRNNERESGKNGWGGAQNDRQDIWMKYAGAHKGRICGRVVRVDKGNGWFGNRLYHCMMVARLVGEGRFETCPYRFRWWWAKGDGSPHSRGQREGSGKDGSPHSETFA